MKFIFTKNPIKNEQIDKQTPSHLAMQNHGKIASVKRRMTKSAK